MCNKANGLFSYWPQFVAFITAAQRILGSVGQSWASFRHHTLVSPDPGPTTLQMGLQPAAGLTGLRNRGAGQKGYGAFLPFQFGCWWMPHAGARKVTDQPSLPSFPLLFVSVGKIKKVWGFGNFLFWYNFLQKVTKIYKDILHTTSLQQCFLLPIVIVRPSPGVLQKSSKRLCMDT